jgi:hypothetical protein
MYQNVGGFKIVVNDSIFLELNDEMKEIDKEKASPAC